MDPHAPTLLLTLSGCLLFRRPLHLSTYYLLTRSSGSPVAAPVSVVAGLAAWAYGRLAPALHAPAARYLRAQSGHRGEGAALIAAVAAVWESGSAGGESGRSGGVTILLLEAARAARQRIGDTLKAALAEVS